METLRKLKYSEAEIKRIYEIGKSIGFNTQKLYGNGAVWNTLEALGELKYHRRPLERMSEEKIKYSQRDKEGVHAFNIAFKKATDQYRQENPMEQDAYLLQDDNNFHKNMAKVAETKLVDPTKFYDLNGNPFSEHGLDYKNFEPEFMEYQFVKDPLQGGATRVMMPVRFKNKQTKDNTTTITYPTTPAGGELIGQVDVTDYWHSHAVSSLKQDLNIYLATAKTPEDAVRAVRERWASARQFMDVDLVIQSILESYYGR